MSPLCDTIAAIATASGEGGIAIVRVSGRGAAGVAAAVLRTRAGAPMVLAPRSVVVGCAVEPARGRALDEVVVLWMPGPGSYTREDVLEIQCHGGAAAARAVLDGVLASGARLADRGEFTLRAYLSGRLDLVQAEAVLDVIRARTDESLRVHEQLLTGRLSEVVHDWQGRLGKVLMELEAQLDFGEEEDLPGADVAALERSLAEIAGEFRRQLETYGWGRSAREGFSVALVGAPNTGKSSLLNALLDEERAIVSETPGTTRDSIDAWVDACGVPVRIVDTAGLRETRDAVEALGVERARRAAGRADLVLFVLDGSREMTRWEEKEAGQCVGAYRVLPVINKVDLGEVPGEEAARFFQREGVRVSSRTGRGIPELLEALREAAWGGSGAGGEAPLTRVRHREAITSAARCVESALQVLGEGGFFEVVAGELHAARRHLNSLLGWGTAEEVLEGIFSEFCIGK